MIIQFSSTIELGSWRLLDGSWTDPIWVKLLLPHDYDQIIIVSVRQISDLQCCYANFYSQLKGLHDHFPTSIDGNLDFAKDYVDKFLIRMSGLKAFL